MSQKLKIYNVTVGYRHWQGYENEAAKEPFNLVEKYSKIRLI